MQNFSKVYAYVSSSSLLSYRIAMFKMWIGSPIFCCNKIINAYWIGSPIFCCNQIINAYWIGSPIFCCNKIINAYWIGSPIFCCNQIINAYCPSSIILTLPIFIILLQLLILDTICILHCLIQIHACNWMFFYELKQSQLNLRCISVKKLQHLPGIQYSAPIS